MKLQNKLAEIYTNGDTGFFKVGYILPFNDIFYMFKEFDIYGAEDGYSLIKKEYVSRIETGTEYLQKIEVLIEKTKESDWFNEGQKTEKILSLIEANDLEEYYEYLTKEEIENYPIENVMSVMVDHISAREKLILE